MLVVIAALLLGGLWLIYRTIAAERVEREQVSRTTEVLTHLRTVGRATINAETGQRGYLITLDQEYLRPYQSGRAQVGPAIAQLRAEIGDDATARQTELIDQIEALTLEKFDDLASSVTLIEHGRLLDARRDVLTDQGQDTMSALRANIRELEQIENALLQEAVAESTKIEQRVIPLLFGLLTLLLLAIYLGYLLIGRTARAEVEADQAAALAVANDRANLLAKELNHRVKNLFAVTLAIVQLSGRDAPEAKPVLERISDRIRALMNAHEVSQGAADTPVASLAALIETALSPYRSETLNAHLAGPEVKLSPDQVTPLGLVLHELVTNTVKYGAWSQADLQASALSVEWSVTKGNVALSWRETGFAVAGEPARQGFGTMLMSSAARQLQGSIERTFGEDGVSVKIAFPVADKPPQ